MDNPGRFFDRFCEELSNPECPIDDFGSPEEANAYGRLAKYHGILPRLPNRPSLAALRRANQSKALRNLAHLIKIKQRFEKIDIPFLVIKGLPLAVLLHGDIGGRHAGDIDLWIPEGRLDDARGVLESLGHGTHLPYFSLTEPYRDLYRQLKFHIGFKHSQQPLSVELHWRLGKTPEAFPISFEKAFETRESVAIGETHFDTLNRNDHLLYLYVHASNHLWERLFWLDDLIQFHKKPNAPSPAEILERARRFGVERNVLPAFVLMNRYLGWSSGLEDRCDSDWFATQLVKMGDQHLRSDERINTWQAQAMVLLMNRSPGALWRELYNQLTAPDDWYRCPLPPGFHWAYVVLRPFLRIMRGRRQRT